MKIYKLERQQLLTTDITTAWEFFSAPENLASITPPWLDFKVTSSPPDKMHAGLIITYTVRPLLGLPIHWTTEITHCNEPSYFVDEQRFGPYRFWHHQHTFAATDNGTLMTDLVHYGFWLPIFQDALNRHSVEPKLRAIFDFRARAIEAMFNKQ